MSMDIRTYVRESFCNHTKMEYVYRDALRFFEEAKELPMPYKYGEINAVPFALQCVKLWLADSWFGETMDQPKERVSFRGTMTPDSGWFCADGIGGESDRCVQ